jgi:hypothetical protein
VDLLWIEVDIVLLLLLSRCFRLRVDIDQLEGIDILCETKGALLDESVALILREVDTAISVDVDCRPRELETLEL